MFKSGGSGSEKSKAKYAAALCGCRVKRRYFISVWFNECVETYIMSMLVIHLVWTIENRATTNDIVTNLVDGLMENDQYGNYIHLEGLDCF